MIKFISIILLILITACSSSRPDPMPLPEIPHDEIKVDSEGYPIENKVIKKHKKKGKKLAHPSVTK